MKKAIVIMAILPVLFKISGARHSSSSVFSRHELLPTLENVPGGTGQDLPPMDDNSTAILQRWTARQTRNATPRIVRRGDKQSEQFSEAERLEQARRRIQVLGLSRIPRASRIPRGPPPSSQRSPWKGHAKPGAFNPPSSSKIPRAPFPNMQRSPPKGQTARKESRAPSISKIPSAGESQRPSLQEGRVTLGELSPSSISRLPRLSQTRQALNSVQDQTGGMEPKPSKLIRLSRPGGALKENSDNLVMDWNAKGYPTTGQLRSNPQASPSTQQEGRAVVSLSPFALASHLDSTSKPRQPTGPSKEKSEVASLQLQGSDALDVVGIPPGLAKIKTSGDTTGGLYERLGYIYGGSNAETTSAYFQHISMLGPPKAPVSRPPGIPRPPRNS